jgi:hypothetical protein
VLAGVEKFLEKRFKLKINKAKSAVAKPIPGLQLYWQDRTAAPYCATGDRPL